MATNTNKFFLMIIILCISVMSVQATTSEFIGTPTSGYIPLTVSFTDQSTGSPTGWAWYFGDETYNGTWVQQNASSGWTARTWSTSVALPDGSIVIMGGFDGNDHKNDVWRSTDKGVTWVQQTASAGWTHRFGLTSVALSDGSIVLMGGYDGGAYKNDVWRSTDKGITWAEQSPSRGWAPRWRHTSITLPDDSIVLMGGSASAGLTNDVWRSTDKGVTWVQQTASAGWTARYSFLSVALPDGSIVLMGGGSNDVWRSTDKGVTWVQQTASAGWTARKDFDGVALPDGSIVLMGGYTTHYMNDVWRSTDKGVTWVEQNASADWASRYALTSVVLPEGSIMLMGGYGSLGYKNDIWRLETASSYEQNPSHTYNNVGTYNIVLNSYNTNGYDAELKNEYITVSNAPPMISNFIGTPTSGYRPLTVNFTDRSTGSPTGWAWYFGDETYNSAWVQQTTDAVWMARYYHTSVALPDGSIVLMGGYDSNNNYYNDVWRSTNKGITWVQQTANAEWSARYMHNSVALSDGSIVLMGGEDGNNKNDTWRSTDKGVTWTLQNASSGWSARILSSSVVLSDGSIILTGGMRENNTDLNDTWRSTDMGATWVQQTANAEWSARDVHTSVAMKDGSIVLMGGTDNSGGTNDVWRSTNQGITWSLQTANAEWSTRDGHTSVALSDGSIVLMGGSGYDTILNDTWRSTDMGATWSRLSASSGWLARTLPTSVVMTDGSIVLMGGLDDSGGTNDVWRLETSGSTSQNPVHIYASIGQYNVTLFVYNAYTSNITNKINYITVTERPESTGGGNTVYYTPKNVRFFCRDLWGNPIVGMTAKVYGVETTLGSLDWVASFFGINLDTTPVITTLMTGTTGSDGSIIFIMMDTEKYSIQYTAPELNINETRYYYPKQEEYIEVFWPETDIASSTVINILLTNRTINTTYTLLGVTYSDTTGHTNNLTFFIDNNTIRNGLSTTRRVYTTHINNSAQNTNININYTVSNIINGGYYWGVVATSSSYKDTIDKTRYIGFENSQWLINPLNAQNGDATATTAYNAGAIGILIVFFLLFGRSSIKIGSVIIMMMGLFFWGIGWLQVPFLLVAIAAALGILLYFRFSEQDG